MRRLLLLGASCRAAAWSLRHSGIGLIAADLFGDVDLRRLCPTRRVARFPEDLAASLAEIRPDGWLYCGGFENHPELVDRLAQLAPLWGNAGTALRGVRDPQLLHQSLAAAGFCTPRIFTGRETASRWLQKPRKSGGGLHIGFVSPDGGTPAPENCETPFYYQEHIEGLSASAIFLARRDHASLLGVTEQLTGTCWLGASGFQYAGSVGPLTVSPDLWAELTRLGNCLTETFSLEGLFGVDLIVRDERAWTIEVNPRYTASVEILERAMGLSLLERHVGWFLQEPDRYQNVASTGPCWGKGILYARNNTTIGPEFQQRVDDWNSDPKLPGIMDLPEIGEEITAGSPVTTVFATGPTIASVKQELEVRARVLQQTLRC